jgi:hypothetical protein
MKHVLLAAMAAAALLAGVTPGRANCDPYAAALAPAAAQFQRPDGDLQAAKAIADRIALRPPGGDFHALYFSHRAALGMIDKADQQKGTFIPPSQAFRNEIAQLKTLSKRLPQMDQVCVRRQNLSRILGFIGSEYLTRAQLAQSECWLLRAYDRYGGPNSNDPAGNLNVTESLGLVYLFQRKYDLAHFYYQAAAAAGSATARQLLVSNQFVHTAPAIFGEPTSGKRESAACRKADSLP